MAEHEGAELRAGVHLSPLVPLKIAYEFAVLIMGLPLLKQQQQLDEIGEALVARNRTSSAFKVEELMAKDYHPIHGIMLEGSNPHVVMQVRLFGRLAYRVHFRRLAFDMKPLAYTHDLSTGKEWTNRI